MADESLSIDRGELERRLKAVAERDRHLVVWFAARCALRVFPLLAESGGFYY